MSRTCRYLPFVVVLLSGCTSRPSERESRLPPAAAESAATAEGPSEVQDQSGALDELGGIEPDSVRDVQGLMVGFYEDGRISLRGIDRWGGQLDTVYESADYLRGAIPVLSLSVTAAQAQALQNLAAELPSQH